MQSNGRASNALQLCQRGTWCSTAAVMVPRVGGMKIRIEVVGAITFAIISFAVLPVAQAVSPAPDGGYLGYNTAEGDDALFSLDTNTGIANTAVGWSSLKNDLTGS